MYRKSYLNVMRFTMNTDCDIIGSSESGFCSTDPEAQQREKRTLGTSKKKPMNRHVRAV